MAHVGRVSANTHNGTASQSLLFLPRNAGSNLAGRKCVVLVHGRAGSARQVQVQIYFYAVVRALTAAGYVVMSVDGGSRSQGAGTTDATRFQNPWGNDDSMTDITAARTYLVTTLGASGSTKIGFIDYSIGGGVGFNWMSRNSGLSSGCVSSSGALDFDFYYNNFANYKAEAELAYAATKTTTTGSGTLTTSGTTVTVASTTGFPASGTFVLYSIGTMTTVTANDPLIVTYTGGGGGGTSFTGCTIASGSRTWGTGVSYTGVGTTGGYATNKTTRSPLLIATNVVFDAVPVHVYTAADDAVTGRASTPIKTQSDSLQFKNAVGSNAVFHEHRGRQWATTATTITDTKTISTSTTLNLTSAAAWPTSGAGVIEVGATESFVFGYTGKSSNQLTGVTATVPTSQAVTSGQVAYASLLDGHVYPFVNVPPSDIVTIVNGFSW